MVEAEQAANPKLDRIRALMEEVGLHAFVCFHMDQHNSEYIAGCDERIAFISGFKGTNGICVVTQTDAKMWTDGRYYLQAQKQLESGWDMMKLEQGAIMWPDHVKSKLSANQVVGLDYSQYPAARLEVQIQSLKKSNIVLQSVPNLVDVVWGEERPPRPCNPVSILDIQFAGKTSLEKQA